MSDLTEISSGFLDKICGQTEEIAKPKATISPPITPKVMQELDTCHDVT
jgi:hypothetical protein